MHLIDIILPFSKKFLFFLSHNNCFFFVFFPHFLHWVAILLPYFQTTLISLYNQNLPIWYFFQSYSGNSSSIYFQLIFNFLVTQHLSFENLHFWLEYFFRLSKHSPLPLSSDNSSLWLELLFRFLKILLSFFVLRQLFSLVGTLLPNLFHLVGILLRFQNFLFCCFFNVSIFL